MRHIKTLKVSTTATVHCKQLTLYSELLQSPSQENSQTNFSTLIAPAGKWKGTETVQVTPLRRTLPFSP